jgi:hypothetical protein
LQSVNAKKSSEEPQNPGRKKSSIPETLRWQGPVGHLPASQDNPRDMTIPTASQITQWLEESRRQKEQDQVFSSRLTAIATSQTRWTKYFEALAQGEDESSAKHHLNATL